MRVVKFGDVVKDVKINVDRNNNPYEYYIAGDHMYTEDLTLRKKGVFATDDVGPAFIRIFKPGQVLYGSRRTYLKKVAVADFEGITANTTFVLETKDNDIFSQRLLPFLILSDSFTKWSIKKSKGSTNPYVLFSDLASYEFELPPIKEQKILADKLWAAYNLKEAYKRMIIATDEMVKSQFIEMFGNSSDVPLSYYVSSLTAGKSLVGGSPYSKRVLKTGAVTYDYFNETEYKFLPDDYITREEHKISIGDIIISRMNTPEFVGATAYVDKLSTDLYLPDRLWKANLKENVNPIFIWQALLQKSSKLQLSNTASGTSNSMKNISKPNMLAIQIKEVNFESQCKFADIVIHADKSKYIN